jgi:hypothetical protein
MVEIQLLGKVNRRVGKVLTLVLESRTYHPKYGAQEKDEKQCYDYKNKDN